MPAKPGADAAALHRPHPHEVPMLQHPQSVRQNHDRRDEHRQQQPDIDEPAPAVGHRGNRSGERYRQQGETIFREHTQSNDEPEQHEVPRPRTFEQSQCDQHRGGSDTSKEGRMSPVDKHFPGEVRGQQQGGDCEKRKRPGHHSQGDAMQEVIRGSQDCQLQEIHAQDADARNREDAAQQPGVSQTGG